MKTLLVFGNKTFKITVAESAKITFGPWSPPKKNAPFDHSGQALSGTLRIYDGKNVIAVFSGVTGYRDLSLDYCEQVAKEEGAVLWKSDQDGYSREDKRSLKKEWVQLAETNEGKKRK